MNALAHSLWKTWVLSKLRSAIGNTPVRLVLWDGTQNCPANLDSVGTILIKDWRSLLRLAIAPEVYFGDDFSEGRIEIDGDLPRMLGAVYGAMSMARKAGLCQRLATRLQGWAQNNSLRGSRRNIHEHYDLGTDFYKLWLDSRLVYTCAYFAQPFESLEEAQVEKMHHVCRKIELKPGDRVVEAGCGWGALALHMAKYYGARVTAYNISHDQIMYARQQARREGLAGQVEFIEDDYRRISGKFDVFVSVGMLEHVGVRHFAELSDTIHRCLKDAGRGFLHFIGRNRPMRFNPWIRKRIFPGAYAPSLGESMELFEKNNFSVLDIENLRLHYARTLEHWLDRFEGSADKVAAAFDPSFARAWKLYLAGSLAAFRAGSLQLFQIVFARSRNNCIPWTRAHQYLFGQGDQQCISAIS